MHEHMYMRIYVYIITCVHTYLRIYEYDDAYTGMIHICKYEYTYMCWCVNVYVCIGLYV